MADDDTTLLRGGLIVDGSGDPARPGDVLLRGGRIEAIGDVPSEAGTVIDCTDKVIAPGFIDAHSHMDFFAPSEDPHHFDPFTAQGVTTFVAGNCGFSPFGFVPDTKHRGLLENSLFKAGRDARLEQFRRISWGARGTRVDAQLRPPRGSRRDAHLALRIRS